MNEHKGYIIENKPTSKLSSLFFQWETILVVIFILINIYNALMFPGYLNFNTLISAPMNFLDKAFMVFPMTLILVLGLIDISVGSTVALSAVAMGVTFNMGLPMGASIIVCLVVATSCGLLNGLIVNSFPELPPMIITLATMTLYRGLAYILLENKAVSGFPQWFQGLSWGYIGSFPIILVVFFVFAIFFILLLQKTTFGRELYGMGNNMSTSYFSGIRVKRNTLIVFGLMGLMAGVTALFLASNMSSVRADIAVGYELEVIAMCVLGGISTSGGKGKMLGSVIAVFIIGFLRYGLGILNVQSQIITMILGILLVVSVLVTRIDLRKTIKKGL